MLVASFHLGIKTPPALHHALGKTCFSHATFINFHRIHRTPEAVLYTLYGTPLGPGDYEALVFLTACSTSFHLGAQTSIWYSSRLIGGMSDGIDIGSCLCAYACPPNISLAQP